MLIYLDRLRLWLKSDAGESLRSWISGTLSLQKGRAFLWIPVIMGSGCAAYLHLNFEPSWIWLLLSLGATSGLCLAIHRFNFPKYVFYFTIIFAIFISGISLCKLRAERVAAPVTDASRTQYRVQAYIVDIVSSDAESPRLLLAPVKIENAAANETPIRVRVTLRNWPRDIALKPGQMISGFMILNPPSRPFMPGGYDFSRAAWFDGLGAVGFVPGKLRLMDSAQPPRRLQRIMDINALRWSITQNLVDSLEPKLPNGRALGGFAAALVTGHQAYLTPQMIQDMRDSGLAHILSISGLHMAIVGGFIFFASRALLALFPILALNYPIKKWAAVAAIAGVLAYLCISGGPAPAIRAAIVATIAFAAILIDRRALSLRALAVAALIVLMLMPEAVIEPGFQMSFAATAALLALAESVKPVVREIGVPWFISTIQAAGRAIWLSLMASLVAGLATTPFSLHYFNRISVYGLISNLLSSPISSFLLMPALAIGTALQATPLSTPFMYLAGAGLWLTDKIAAWTASLEGAVRILPSAPDYVLLISFAGVLWLCLIRGTTRWIGMIAAVSIIIWPRVTPPDVWVDSQGANAAISYDGASYVMRPKVKQYGYEQWLRHYGLNDDRSMGLSHDYVCKGLMCTPNQEAKYRIGFWFGNKMPKTEALSQLCEQSELVILRANIDQWPKACEKTNRIDKDDLEHLGALELRRRDNLWIIHASEPARGERAWVR
ncbi:ComEC/Rec2 family competence protein [Asticcacaulis machinosus]|uniref:ComEC/Rec2 family competence protein n=1 Tax=Asticcacaulis machinosus TaxID=2984211 RepID=A0ABT5HFJ7_9CAUL|nr:ComEC/Rec2 family competence protein [Asticcacaulis machinosus]MDC7674798.1 ComEC/Rec2 family competence protein [Asticcacaulis machinosus]